MLAASSNESARGFAKICARGTTTCDAYPPKRVTAITSVPIATSRASAPTASTVPATSKPGVIGYPT
ncbi:Hypothetical protein I5071_22460 [Sandaracinus amylolyticus]|nr:Hypothetical protein I5071_22460 [Sandaracinus amylolyticus]